MTRLWSERPTLLIVDDDACLRRAMRRLLSEYDVVEAGSTLEALEALQSFTTFQAVLTDLDLGDDRRGGLRVARVCAAVGLPVIMISGSLWELTDGERPPVCLAKPCDPRTLEQLLVGMVTSRA